MKCSAAAQAGSESDLSLPGIQNTGAASEFQVEFSPIKGLLVIQGHSRGRMGSISRVVYLVLQTCLLEYELSWNLKIAQYLF